MSDPYRVDPDGNCFPKIPVGSRVCSECVHHAHAGSQDGRSVVLLCGRKFGGRDPYFGSRMISSSVIEILKKHGLVCQPTESNQTGQCEFFVRWPKPSLVLRLKSWWSRRPAACPTCGTPNGGSE